MRRSAAALLALLLWAGRAGGEEASEAYVFASDLVYALHFCQWALDYEMPNGADPTRRLTARLNQNRKLLEARAGMEKYRNDPDDKIRSIARGVVSGVDLIMLANRSVIQEVVEGSSAPARAAHAGSEEEEKSRGWEMIAVSAAYTGAYWTGVMEEGRRRGPEALAALREDGRSLLNLIEASFETDLGLHRRHEDSSREGLQDPDDPRMALIGAVQEVRARLMKEVFEEGTAAPSP